VTAHINVPYGTYATTYYGTLTVTNGETDDQVRVKVTVTPSYDVDVAENTVDLGTGELGDTVSAIFRVVNPNSDASNIDPDMFGNADIDSVTFTLNSALKYVGKSTNVKTVVDSAIPAANVLITTIGTMASGSGVDHPVEVVIPANVLAGTYAGYVYAHAYAGGAEVSMDSFQIELNVKATPSIAVIEDTVTTSSGHGSVATVTFRIANTGNVDLANINFQATNFVGGSHVIDANNVTFTPTSISYLPVDDSADVSVAISVPLGTYATDYYGVVTVTNGQVEDHLVVKLTVTPSYDLDISDNEMNLVGNTMVYSGEVGDTVAGLHFKVINPNNDQLNVDPDPFGNADLTGIKSYVTDLVAPNGCKISANNAQVVGLSTTIASGGFSTGEVRIAIPVDQVSGTYLGKVVVEDTVSGVADSFDIQVTVMPHEVVDITMDTLNFNGKEGGLAEATFMVANTGNIGLKSLKVKMVSDLVSTNGVVISRNRVAFTKSVIDSIARGDTASVTVRIDIPKHVARGTYLGWLMVSGANGTPSDSALIVLNISSNEAISFDNNPVTGSTVKIGYSGDVGYRPTLTIMNMAADVVLKVVLPAITGTNDVYKWNLTNKAGNAVAPGLYIVMLKTKVNGKIKVYRSKLLILR